MTSTTEMLTAAERADAQAAALEAKGGPRRLARAHLLREDARLWRWQIDQARSAS